MASMYGYKGKQADANLGACATLRAMQAPCPPRNYLKS